MRKVHIDGVPWTYEVSKRGGVLIVSPRGERYYAPLGLDADGSTTAVTPAGVKEHICSVILRLPGTRRFADREASPALLRAFEALLDD
jgi:hypothetical protein